MMRSWPRFCALAAAAALGIAAARLEAQEALTLCGSIAAALENNPQLAAARHARESARIEAERFKPAFRPDLQASLSQIARGPRLEFPKRNEQVTVLPNLRTKLELDLQHPVYQMGLGTAPRDRYQALTDAADADYDKAELDLCLQVAEAYYTTLQTEELERVAVEGVRMAQEQRRITGILVDAGQLADVERYRAETSLAEAQSGEVRARNGVRLALANLNRLLGRPVTADGELEPVAGTPPLPPETEALLPQAVADRPEAEALRARIDAAEAGVHLARIQRLPKVNGQLNYQLQNPSAFVPTSQWLVGVVAAMPVFETATIRFNVRQAEEGLAQAKAGLRALEQGIALEIEQARLAMFEAGERLQVAERGLEQAQQVLETTSYAYGRGYAIQTEVDGARLAVTRAEGDRARATYDMWIAQARLRRALGYPCDALCGADGGAPRRPGAGGKGEK